MNLESQILVQWSTKVDALMLYVAELEDKIRQEREARERLALMYDQSLTTGYTRLQSETVHLSQNPLIHEVTVPYCDHPAAGTNVTAMSAEARERYLEIIAASQRNQPRAASHGQEMYISADENSPH